MSGDRTVPRRSEDLDFAKQNNPLINFCILESRARLRVHLGNDRICAFGILKYPLPWSRTKINSAVLIGPGFLITLLPTLPNQFGLAPCSVTCTSASKTTARTTSKLKKAVWCQSPKPACDSEKSSLQLLGGSRLQSAPHGLRKLEGVPKQFFPVDCFQAQFIECRGQSLLPLEIDPVKRSLFRLRNSVRTVSRALHFKTPVQVLGDVAIDNLHRRAAKFPREAGRHAGQGGRTLRRDPHSARADSREM
jgi:hypothetical protein